MKRRYSISIIAIMISLFVAMLTCVVFATWIIAAPSTSYKPSAKRYIHLAPVEANYADFHYLATPTDDPEAQYTNWSMVTNLTSGKGLSSKLEHTDEDGTTYINFVDDAGEIIKFVKGKDYKSITNIYGATDGNYRYGTIAGMSAYGTATNTVSVSSNYFAGSTYMVSITMNGLTMPDGDTGIDPLYNDTSSNTASANRILVRLTYKTVQIGTTINFNAADEDWYTIEEALLKAGNDSSKTIVTVGCNTTGAARTAFTSLPAEITGNKLEPDEAGLYNYNVAGKLRVPFGNVNYDYDGKNGSGGNGGTSTTVTGADRAYSALVVPQHIRLNVIGTLNIGGLINHTGSVRNRGVVMNDGLIDVTGTVSAYGYLKTGEASKNDTTGKIKGQLVINGNATAIDVLKVHDWKGGTNGSGVGLTYKVFPINAFSVHNIGCDTIFWAGSTYETYWAFNMSNQWKCATDSKSAFLRIIGSDSSSNTLFKLSNGYIKKTANGGKWNDPASSTATNAANYLSTVTGSNQVAGQFDVFELHGKAVDGQVDITIDVPIVGEMPMATSTDNPLPISYMDIVVCGDDGKGNVGDLTFDAASYKFLPGSSLIVTNGANLTIGKNTSSKATLFIYTYDECDSDEHYTYVADGGATTQDGYQSFTAGGFCKYAKDAEFIVNGTATINGNLGGTALTEGSTGRLIINGNASGSIHYITYLKYEKGFIPRPATVNTAPRTSLARGQILRYDANSDSQQFERATYKARENTWVADGATITIDIVYNGNVIHSKQGVVANGTGVQLTEEDINYVRTALGDAYEFLGIFLNHGAQNVEIGTKNVFYASITLEANYRYSGYQVIYDANGGSFNGSGQYSDTFSVFKSELIETKPTMTGHTFKGWYLDQEGNGDPVTALTEDMFEDHVLTLYAKWEVASYALKFSSGTGVSSVTVNVEGMGNITSGTLVPYGAKVTVTVKESSDYKDPTFTITSPSGISVDGNTFYMPASDVTITTSASQDSGCVVEGTMITLADGTQKPIEELKPGDEVLAFNHETGMYEAGKMWFIDDLEKTAEWYTVINLEFNDGTKLRISYQHALFDLDLNKYVYINEGNYNEFVGHRFTNVTLVKGEFVSGEIVLTKAYLTEEYTRIFGPISEYHMNLVTDSLLTMPSFPYEITGFINIFEYGEGMKYDEAKMQADIAQYGLFTYEDFAEFMSEEDFNKSPAKWLKVALGKGILRWEEIEWIIEFLYEVGGFTG